MERAKFELAFTLVEDRKLTLEEGENHTHLRLFENSKKEKFLDIRVYYKDHFTSNGVWFSLEQAEWFVRNMPFAATKTWPNKSVSFKNFLIKVVSYKIYII
jgi:hypothetical protein